MIGRIQKIMEGTAKNGNKYWLISIEGKYFAAWTSELVEGLKDGDLVDITWQDSNGFRNIEKIVRVQNPGNGKEVMDAKTRHIIRMSCLRSAVELMANLGIKRPSMKKLLSLSSIFENYVYGANPEQW
ncbi:MAG: hypothetical protein QW491_09905 [Thermoproteota archaeon]